MFRKLNFLVKNLWWWLSKMSGLWFIVSFVNFHNNHPWFSTRKQKTDGRWKCSPSWIFWLILRVKVDKMDGIWKYSANWIFWLKLMVTVVENVRALVYSLIRKFSHRSPLIFNQETENWQYLKMFRKLNFLVENWWRWLWKMFGPWLIVSFVNFHIDHPWFSTRKTKIDSK